MHWKSSRVIDRISTWSKSTMTSASQGRGGGEGCGLREKGRDLESELGTNHETLGSTEKPPLRCKLRLASFRQGR